MYLFRSTLYLPYSSRLLYILGVFGLAGALLHEGIQLRLHPLDGLRVH